MTGYSKRLNPLAFFQTSLECHYTKGMSIIYKVITYSIAGKTITIADV